MGKILIPILCLAVLIIVSLAIYLTWRLRALYQRVGSFDVTWRRESGPWHEGVAMFGAHRLDIYKPISFSRRPQFSLSRTTLQIISNEAYPDQPGSRIVHVRANEVPAVVVLKADAFAGVISWMDAAGPREEPSVLF